MNIEKLSEEIKQEEGFRNKVYKDSLGFATIGYGHLIKPDEFFDPKKVYSNKELDKIFEYDLNIALNDARLLCSGMELKDEAVEIITAMCFQLGKPRVKKFKKMFEALRNKEYVSAGFEMEDSLWCRQTPQRVYRMSEKMKKLEE
tara:strand:- start:279 stop:713 length:435 start_codon:yes stop_codon:yes gene_type:complete